MDNGPEKIPLPSQLVLGAYKSPLSTLAQSVRPSMASCSFWHLLTKLSEVMARVMASALSGLPWPSAAALRNQYHAALLPPAPRSPPQSTHCSVALLQWKLGCFLQWIGWGPAWAGWEESEVQVLLPAPAALSPTWSCMPDGLPWSAQPSCGTGP